MTYAFALDRHPNLRTIVQVAGRPNAPWHYARGWNAYLGIRTACEIYLNLCDEAAVYAEAVTECVTCKRCLRAIDKARKESNEYTR